jgi:hypothetical protein
MRLSEIFVAVIIMDPQHFGSQARAPGEQVSLAQGRRPGEEATKQARPPAEEVILLD